jgi:predicted metal-binding protein
MPRVELSICVRCDGGEDLYQEVKAIRRSEDLKPVFKVLDVRCVGFCDEPICIELSGKKRSTYGRCQLGVRDAAELVRTACAYAALGPGEELSERMLPGEEPE